MANDKSEIFKMNTYDLGSATSGLDKTGVDHMFRMVPSQSAYVLHCLTGCANEPVAYIGPKGVDKATYESQMAPICQHCLQYYSTEHYVLKNIVTK